MKYILIMHCKKWRLGCVRPKEDQPRNVEFTQRFNKELHDSVFLWTPRG
jgi:hypothetical protein